MTLRTFDRALVAFALVVCLYFAGQLLRPFIATSAPVAASIENRGEA